MLYLLVTASFHTRPFVPEDIPTAIEWMIQEKWPVSLNKTRACYNQDPQGCIAAVNESGEMIGKTTSSLYFTD